MKIIPTWPRASLPRFHQTALQDCSDIGSISSLLQISLNIIDIFCLHIFFWIRSYCRIAFIVFGGNCYFANNINEINILQDIFQKSSVLNFTHELNKNNKISFLDVLIDTNKNNNFTTSTYKKPSSNNSCTLNFKSECPFRYKKAIINNLISRAKLISSSKTIFYKEVENIKQALINNGFPNYIVNEQIKRMIKNVNQQNKHCTTSPSQ